MTTGRTPRFSLRQRAAALVATFKRELAVYRAVIADRRTPWLARLLLASAIGYALMPFDLIPDWIPVLGLLDDLVIVPGLVWLALRMVPRGLVEEHRRRVGTPGR